MVQMRNRTLNWKTKEEGQDTKSSTSTDENPQGSLKNLIDKAQKSTSKQFGKTKKGSRYKQTFGFLHYSAFFAFIFFLLCEGDIIHINRFDKDDNSQVASDASKPSSSCANYNGVLWINRVDKISGPASNFFPDIINQLIYAEMNNLMPWIHLDGKYNKIYDAAPHQSKLGNDALTFTVQKGLPIEGKSTFDQGICQSSSKYQYPTYPNIDPMTYAEEEIKLECTGIWDSYFHPVSDYEPNDPSCAQKPVFTFTPLQVSKGIKYCAPWAIRTIKTDGFPITEDTNTLFIKNDQKMSDWLMEQRKNAAPFVKAFYKPLPYLQTKIDEANKTSKTCLAMHIRRTKNDEVHVDLNAYMNYATAFMEAGGKRIYLATASESVYPKIKSSWSSKIHKRIIRNKRSKSSSTEQHISEQVNHHQSNMDAIVDIYAMAKCDFILHGQSSLSEAVIYVKPELQDRSVNFALPPEERMDIETFKKEVKSFLKNAKSNKKSKEKNVSAESLRKRR